MALAGANEGEQAAAREPPPPIILATSANALPPPATLDPRLFMAARRGDSKQLKDLLLLEDEEEEPAATAVDDTPSVEAAPQFVLEVDPGFPGFAPAAAPVPAPLPVVVLDGGGVTMEGDSLLHVVAACGDGEEFIKCAKMIVRDKERKGGAAAKRLVLEARNKNGDTPLHCAAGAGNAEMISCLVALANTADVKAFVRMRNQCGETSLHQAIRAANNNDDKVVCIDRLMAVDPDLACIPQDGEEGASPLYLAISLGEIEIARHMLINKKGRLSYSGPDGRNVLHAAVCRGQETTGIIDPLQPDGVLLMLLVKFHKEAAAQGDHRRMSSSSEPDLLWQLTSQRDELNGSTPLHLAASLGARPWNWLLCRLYPHQVWSWSGWHAAAELLDANVSTAYQADNGGSYPIHVAAWSGYVSVVHLLLKKCPDSATLRDGKGRTFLHVAAEAEEEEHDVVRYVCERPQYSSILNAQDKNGDTPLHRAVHAGNVTTFRYLIRNRQNPRSIIEKTLAFAGAPHGSVRPQLLYEKYIAKRDVDGESEKHTQATQVMSIVAVLIATVTFASAFTVPGGYRAEGTPVLAGTGGYAFDAFILADTLAFICSCLATFSLVYAGVPAMDLSIRTYYFNLSALLLQNAGRSFVAAFGLCLYLVLAPVDRMVAAAVCVVTFASLLLGNMEAWKITCLAITVRARAGVRPYALRTYAQAISSEVLVHFGSLIIIFGLPAIRKWARSTK
ncbi:ankyrin-2-like isoform X2 [Panicum hallii]|uniref:ankyrin-2-like isoform X2 n=1 Tax=Panicum hallii TaxID=206008 RepID=UPI000DF4E67D|nr:ankyrin-2-like isoform X2 [Panicum hallii]